MKDKSIEKKCGCDCELVGFRIEIDDKSCQCKCHSPIEKDWKDEFDALFLETMYKDSGYSEERAVIKDFIRREKQLSFQAGREHQYEHPDDLDFLARSQENKEI